MARAPRKGTGENRTWIPGHERLLVVRVIERRFFGGLSVEETAEALGISVRTVKRDWILAKAWLHRKLGEDGREKSG